MSYLQELLGDAYKEGMTEEEISDALKSIDTRYKNAISKANSEAASFKRQLKERMTAEEKAEQERQEAQQALLEENKALKRSIALAETKAKLISTGYTEELADETATAMLDGDTEKIIANQVKFVETAKKAYLAENIKSFPEPKGNTDNTKSMTKESFRKLSVAERAKYATEHPDEYKAMYEGS